MLLSRLVDYAGDYHARTEIVCRRIGGSIERGTWGQMRARAKRLAKALTARGFGADSRIGTLAWNTSDHLEVIYGALGIGTAVHTLNPRLTVDDLKHMVEMVGEDTIFIDVATLPIAAALAPVVASVTRWVLMDDPDDDARAEFPGLIHKRDFVEGFDADFTWPSFDERQAATICFTSGTTGRPKGVVYSHRSLTLTAMNMSMADMYGNHRAGEMACALPMAAIFHANAWIMPFTAPMNGHKLVLSGRAFDAPSAIELINAEGVTIVGAVPTIWRSLADTLDELKLQAPTLKTALMAGSRPSLSLIERLSARGIAVCPQFGMTEAPGASRTTPPPGSDQHDGATRAAALNSRQGRMAFQWEARLKDDAGSEVPHDGQRPGRLFVRGPSIASGYLNDPSVAVDWLDTGDIAKIYPDGTFELVDRAKDVIKSGGEWISTPQLEAAAMSHPAIFQAAAISVPHPRWDERPILLCALVAGCSIEQAELLAHMARSVAKWWLPDEIVFLEELPQTVTGKIDKAALRRKYGQIDTQFRATHAPAAAIEKQ
jgi:fatty-acyl-CoA synthase